MTRRDSSDGAYVIEDTPHGRELVTGRWSNAAAEVLRRGEVDTLVLNYARGFGEPDLGFLDRWPIRSLHVLDRTLKDVEPVARLADSVSELSIQAAPEAELDLGALPRLRVVAGEWALIGNTLSRLDALEDVITWLFDETDLHAFRDHIGLRSLTIKEAPHLESLSGIADLADLVVLRVVGGPELQDISEIAECRESLEEFELEGCSFITDLDDVADLSELTFLGFSNCLREIRMRDRPSYTPRLSTLVDKNARVR